MDYNYNPNTYAAPYYPSEENLPPEYRPLSPWAYFGYNILFAIPILGFILLIVFALSDSNINRRNYARSFFCWLVLLLIAVLIFVILVFLFCISAGPLSDLL